MAEKGGNATPRKSSFKPPTSKSGSSKGKDGRQSKIQIESPDSSDCEDFMDDITETPAKAKEKSSLDGLKSGKKSSFDSLKTGKTPSNAKGGKDGKTGKSGGKGSVPKGLADAAIEVDVNLEIVLPKNAEIITDSEAASILQGIQEYLPALSKDPMLKMPSLFSKVLEHANACDLYSNPEPVREIAQKLKSEGLTDGEVCMIARACPETVEEAFALVPSLKANKLKVEGPVREALLELARLKKST